MPELVVLESLVSLFLLLPLIRPLVKKLWPMDGLVWLPVLALAITIAIFPAYGFRPECIPLLLYGIILNIMNIPSLMSLLAHLKNDDFRERNRGLIFFLFVLLIFTAGTAIYFLPARDTALLADGVQSVTLSDDVRQEKLFVRVYTAEAVSAEPRPVMLLIPPVTGSVLVVDRICGALRDQGFTVITWSRRDFDLAALDGQGQIFRLPIQDLFALFRANSRGSISEAANEAGRFLETGRGSDISFLLDAIKIHRGLPDFDEGPGGATIDWTCIFAAGYGAGGAALLSLAGTPEFIAQNPALRGIITVESPPLSVLKGEDRPPAVISPQDTNWIHSLWTGVSAWAAGLETKKITGMGTIPVPGVPALFLVSDRVGIPKYRDGRYAALLRIFHAAKEPAILAAVSGAGFLDYSDIPEKYPLFSYIVSGKKNKVWAQDEYIQGTAALMTNFAAAVLDGKADVPADSSPGKPLTGVPPAAGALLYQPLTEAPPLLRRQIVHGNGIHLETAGTWNSLKNGDIL